MREVSIPSDADAVRMHPLSAEEEKVYFKRAFEVTDRAGRRNLYGRSRCTDNVVRAMSPNVPVVGVSRK